MNDGGPAGRQKTVACPKANSHLRRRPDRREDAPPRRAACHGRHQRTEVLLELGKGASARGAVTGGPVYG